MFFAPERLPHVRAMILASNADDRKRALIKLLPMQQKDFENLFREMSPLPVTIRLLDPPLHEFLPRVEELNEQLKLAENMPMDAARFGGGFPGAPPPPMAQAAPPGAGVGGGAGHALPKGEKVADGPGDDKAGAKNDGGSTAPARVREFFPETLRWEPSLITNERGQATLPLDFAAA